VGGRGGVWGGGGGPPPRLVMWERTERKLTRVTFHLASAPRARPELDAVLIRSQPERLDVVTGSL
jgi:hypothetical protein